MIGWILVAIYLTGWFITVRILINNLEDIHPSDSQLELTMVGLVSVLAGLAWPIWALGRLFSGPVTLRED